MKEDTLRDNLAWHAVALLSTLAFSIPVLCLLAARGDYLPFAGESIANRFFTNIRLLDGEGGAVWLPQGQLVTVVQQMIVSLLHHAGGMSLFDLQPILKWYSLLTSLAVTLAFAATAVAVVNTKRLTPLDRALILCVGPFVILETNTAGFYYALLPDYIGLNIVIVTAAIYLALAFYRDESPFRLRDIVLAGLFCGVAASNKLTMLGPAGLVVIMAALKPPSGVRQVLFRGVIAGLMALISFGLVFWICYRFSARDALAALAHWKKFLVGAGAESGFWETNFSVFRWAYNYDQVFFGWVVAMVVFAGRILATGAWRSRKSALWLGCLVVACLGGLGLWKRGAGTTFFETIYILAALTAVAVAAAFDTGRWRAAGAVLLAGLMIFATTGFGYKHNWMVVTKSRELARVAWEAHNYAASFGLPVIIVKPDGSYEWSGVEWLLDTGLRDLDTGGFGSALKLKAKFSPQFEYRYKPGIIPPNTVVVWAEKWDFTADRPDVKDAALWEPLNKLASSPTSQCRTWRAGYAGFLLHVCVSR
jgi:hypothetical protein